MDECACTSKELVHTDIWVFTFGSFVDNSIRREAKRKVRCMHAANVLRNSVAILRG